MVDHLSATVELPGIGTVPLPLRPAEEAPATFRGRLALPALRETTAGTLVLQETGPEAIRRAQRISILIPPGLSVDGQRKPESFSAGLNEPVLRAIASAGAGSYDSPGDIEDGSSARSAQWPLWPPLVVVAMACVLGAAFLKRIDP
jgi:hypothetical protein